jgi:2-haloacid dehalogenase
MQTVLVFDLNGTLTDLSTLDPHFQSAFGSAAIRREWFNEMIQLSMVSTMTGYYVEFPKLAKAALDAVAGRYGVQLSPQTESAIVAGTRTAPAFPEVKEALERLRDAGYRMAVLTNSPLNSAEAVLKSAAIYEYFERVLSVDSIRKYKPSPEVYRYGASELKVPLISMLMIAAHAWDTTGAIRAGCGAAFLARPYEVLDPLAPRPRFTASDLGALAAKIIESAS